MSSMGNITIQGIVWDSVWRAHVSSATFIGPLTMLVVVVSIALVYPALKAASLSPIKAIHHR
jgi:ABC-type antimicrobial peptide transport system permease subunit